jgi:hypothetical protein
LKTVLVLQGRIFLSSTTTLGRRGYSNIFKFIVRYFKILGLRIRPMPLNCHVQLRYYDFLRQFVFNVKGFRWFFRFLRVYFEDEGDDAGDSWCDVVLPIPAAARKSSTRPSSPASLIAQ